MDEEMNEDQRFHLESWKRQRAGELELLELAERLGSSRVSLRTARQILMKAYEIGWKQALFEHGVFEGHLPSEERFQDGWKS